MPTCQLFPHSFNRGGFACTFVSAPQEFPSSHTCHIENIPPNFLSGFQFAVSSGCHTLSSGLLSPPSLPPASLSRSLLFICTLPPSKKKKEKKARSPVPPSAAPPPAQFTRGARRDQLWVFWAHSESCREPTGSATSRTRVEARVTESYSFSGHMRECCQDWLCCCSSASTCVCRGSRGRR